MTKHERKLRKKAKKLAKWARRNGYDHVSMYAIGPKMGGEMWYADASAYVGSLRVVSTSDFYAKEEL